MTDGKAIAALVLGICSIVIIFIPYGNLILGGSALIVGIVSFRGASKDSKERSFGRTGIILGGLSTLVGLVMAVYIIMAFGGVGVWNESDQITLTTSFPSPLPNTYDAHIAREDDIIDISFYNNKESSIKIDGTAHGTGDCENLTFFQGSSKDDPITTPESIIRSGEEFWVFFRCSPANRSNMFAEISFEYTDVATSLHHTHTGTVSS